MRLGSSVANESGVFPSHAREGRSSSPTGALPKPIARIGMESGDRRLPNLGHCTMVVSVGRSVKEHQLTVATGDIHTPMSTIIGSEARSGAGIAPESGSFFSEQGRTPSGGWA